MGDKVFIIVLNWNGITDTLECLFSLREIDYPSFEIVVVDNGSSDDSVAQINKFFPDITLLQTGKNLGYAEGNNVGIRHSLEQGADYIFILNNDTIVDSNILTELVSASRHSNDKGIFSAKIFYYDHPNVIWYAGGYWLPERPGFIHDGTNETDSSRFSELKECDFACGCALFLSRMVIEQIGIMDQKFFLTFEETDWCYRAKQFGISSYFVPSARLWHKVSASLGGEDSPLREYFIMRNMLLWAQTHLSFKEFLKVLLRCTIQLTGWETNKNSFSFKFHFWNINRMLHRLFSNKVSNVEKARRQGFLHFLLRRFGDCPADIRLLND
ncbi:glycosyltransferase family 2 protein [Methylomarinum vadi]|uniref:glycosyltransferase family 2 protein n=1 Tax=Methylomarinum vadi TaxID=438855 RepID=UPI0006924A81|nr:glycosyltransferase family 2 protein [Methylomarinum vadi]